MQNIHQPQHVPPPGQIGPSFELVFRCAAEKPLLDNKRWKRALAERIEEALERRELKLAAFVFLPDCVRLVVVQQGAHVNLPRLIYVIKRTFARWVRDELRQSGDTLLRELTVRENPGSYRFRFWEPGPGQLRELREATAVAEVIEAVHASPVSAGLCETPDQWKWSSWRQYHRPGHSPDPDLPRVHALPSAMPSPAAAGPTASP
jgi:hypothetical protein